MKISKGIKMAETRMAVTHTHTHTHNFYVYQNALNNSVENKSKNKTR